MHTHTMDSPLRAEIVSGAGNSGGVTEREEF